MNSQSYILTQSLKVAFCQPGNTHYTFLNEISAILTVHVGEPRSLKNGSIRSRHVAYMLIVEDLNYLASLHFFKIINLKTCRSDWMESLTQELVFLQPPQIQC